MSGITGFQFAKRSESRRLNSLQILNSLPPRKQNEVRRSMNQLNLLPEERRRAINQELRRMYVMPDDERPGYMSTEEFRERFSPEEQRIIGDLAEVLPGRNQ